MDYKNNFSLVFVRNKNNFKIFPFHLIRSFRKVKYINGYGPVNVLLTSEAITTVACTCGIRDFHKLVFCAYFSPLNQCTNLEVHIENVVGLVTLDGDEDMCKLLRLGQGCTNFAPNQITQECTNLELTQITQNQTEQLTIINTLEQTIPVESVVGSGASDGDDNVCQLYRTGQECTNPKPLPKHVTESLAEQPDGISIVESIATGGDENMCKLQRTGQEYTNLELTSKEINQNQAEQLIIVETFEQTIPDKSIVGSLVSDGDENVFNLHRAGQECTNPKLPHITESRVEQGTIIGTSKQTVPDMESVATAGYTDMCQLSRRGLKRHLPEYAIGDSDTESEPFRSSGSEYVPSDIDIISDSENEKSSAQFNEMSSSNSKQTNENYHKPSYCKRLFSNEKESDKLLSSTLEASSDFEISARSIRSAEPCVSSVADSSKISEPDTDSVEKEDLLEYTDNCVRFTTYEGEHQSVIITDNNTSSLTCKSLCDKKSCIMEKEMIISRNITNVKFTLRYATCVGQGVYERSEYFIGDNNYIAVLKKNTIKSMNEQKIKHFSLFSERQLINLTHHAKVRCGAKEPHKLRATLSDNEIQQLADFMGHTVDVHKEHYRKNCNYQQIVVLSRLFMALEAGDIDLFKNETFSDVEIMLQRDEDFPWLEDESQSINEQVNSDELDTEAQDLIEEIGSNFVAENLGAVTEEEINLEMLPSTCGPCVDNPSKQTPSPRSHAIKAVMGFSQKSLFKKKRPFTAEELTVFEKCLGLFIQQGKYPPQPKRPIKRF